MTEEELAIPSNRIRFALEAMREWEARPGCKIDMDLFRDAREGVCFACCGGAARVKKDGLDVSTDNDSWVNPEPSPFEISLDYARWGMTCPMFETMGMDRAKGSPFSRDIADYDHNTTQFYADMNKLADDLQEAGY